MNLQELLDVAQDIKIGEPEIKALQSRLAAAEKEYEEERLAQALAHDEFLARRYIL